MTKLTAEEQHIRRILYGVILSVSLLYVCQIVIFHYRLSMINAEPVSVDTVSESCDDLNCTGVFVLKPSYKYLLLGHVLRSHSLVDMKTNNDVFPISRVRGVASESWMGLRVYAVTPHDSYLLKAQKPRATKLGYFVGILPRSTDHEGVMSVPDISPTIVTITSLAGVAIFAFIVMASFMAPKAGLQAATQRDQLWTVTIAGFFATLCSTISSGAIDSILPDGEIRSRMLRTALVIAITLLPLRSLFSRVITAKSLQILMPIMLMTATVNGGWMFFRAGIIWTFVYGCAPVALSLYLYRYGHRLAGIVMLFPLLDVAKMTGLIEIRDIPPIYLLQTFLISAFSLVGANFGATSVIAMASRAYQRFTRDVSLNQISHIFAQKTISSAEHLSGSVKECLPLIAELTGAGRVSVLINLPSGRPLTHCYSATGAETVTYDDGKIPGAATIRAFVYGDECWYESYKGFAERLNLPTSQRYDSADYVCIAPIRVREHNIGVLMLTQFDDAHIKKSVKSGTIDEERATGRALMDILSAAFSVVMIQNLQSHTDTSAKLLTAIRDLIPAATSSQDFFERYCEAISNVTGMRVMLHKKIDDRGVGLCQAGFLPSQWDHFLRAPFNLHHDAPKAYGSTVVAFKEGKSSYIKDWQEIRDKLHPKTAEMLDVIKVMSFCAVPLKNGDDIFVVTLMSRTDDAPKDPAIMATVESTEAIFDAALTFLKQKSSVMALGALTNRLIGDDDVRNQIIEAAKSKTLPTTIGTARSSFLLLFDLAGSSLLTESADAKARSYGMFYDDVNKSVQQHLGGQIRKTIGDAIIVTWDGSGVNLVDNPRLFDSLRAVFQDANAVAIRVGCAGVRAVLHYGDYFFGLVGTSSFGQIDVIGKAIDEVCKMEGTMKSMKVNDQSVKIAISLAAASRLSLAQKNMLADHGYEHVAGGGGANHPATLEWVNAQLIANATSNAESESEIVKVDEVS